MAEDSASIACCCRSGRRISRSPTARCSPCRRWSPVRQAIDGEFDRYIARHQASLPKETIGVGEGFDFQLFDRALLYSADTRFVLAGIVNRMDRTYVAEASCGEIRLIYRLTRINKAAGDDAAPPRLPMTLNLVLKAKARGIGTITCSEIADRWLTASPRRSTLSARMARST